MVNAVVVLPTLEDQAQLSKILFRHNIKWSNGQDFRTRPIKGLRKDFAVRIKNDRVTSGDADFYLSGEGYNFRNGIEDRLYCCSLQTFLEEIGEAFWDDIEQLPDIGDII